MAPDLAADVALAVLEREAAAFAALLDHADLTTQSMVSRFHGPGPGAAPRPDPALAHDA